MMGVTFSEGTEIWIRGRAARIVNARDLHAIEVEFSSSGERQSLDLIGLYGNGLVTWTPPNAPLPTRRALDSFTEKEWAEARRRESIVAPLLEGGNITKRVMEVAAANGVGRTTIFEWRRIYVQQGLDALVPGYRQRGGRGRSRLEPAREQLLQAELKLRYLVRTKPTIEHAYEEICTTFIGAGLKPPAFNTVRARIKQLNASGVTTAREGLKRSRDRHMVSRGRFPGAEQPLDVIQIDHSPLDVHVVDDEDRSRVLGRPYLTLAVDCATRMVFGYLITFDPPSYMSVATCIKQGVLPKDDVVSRYGLGERWPIFGLPRAIHTDNGKEFQSQALEQFAQAYNIELVRRPTRTPHYGGIIERIIGTVNGSVHPLAGTAKSSVKERGDYDAEKHAFLTIGELERYIARRIVEVYHRQVHRELGKSPLDAWDEAVKARHVRPGVPPDVARFSIDILPSERRTIQKSGIEMFGLHYSAGVLQSLRGIEPRNASSTKYVVKYDPRDLSGVYLVMTDGSVERIPLIERNVPPFTLLEWKLLRKRRPGRLRPGQIYESLQRMRAEMNKAASDTKRARRTKVRSRDQLKAAKAAHGEPPPVEAREKDVPKLGIGTTDSDDGWGTPILYYGG